MLQKTLKIGGLRYHGRLLTMSTEVPGPGNEAVVRFGPFRLDRRDKLLFRDGEAVPLTPKAFEMLDFLVQNAGRVVEKEPLMRGVWPDSFVDEANLSHHVFMLRRALGDDREGNRFIETIPRRGYRFVAPLADPEEQVIIDETVRERMVIEEESDILPVAQSTRPRLALALLIAVAVVAVATAAFVRLRPKSEPPPAKTLRFSIAPPLGTTFRQFPATTELAVSPDGKRLAMIALEGQRRRLFVRELDALTARPIAGSEDAVSPFWSPDGKWIGFFAGGTMKKVALDGAPPQTICAAQGGTGSWNADGQIIFSEWGPETSDAVQMVHESGGRIRDVTNGNAGWGLWPAFLADGHHFVYYRLAPKNGGALLIGSIDDNDTHVLLRVNSLAEIRGDDLFYVRDAVLVRQKVDLKRYTVIGDPIPIAEGAFCFTPLGTANFSLSADAAVIAWQRRMLPTQLVWRDWNGREIARVGKPEMYRKFSISPDGQRIAADVEDATSQITAIWVFDLARGVGTRVASNPVTASSPLWLPKGDSLVIGYGNDLHPQEAPALARLTLEDGSLQILLPLQGPQYATSITADGARVLYTVNGGRTSEIDIFPIANPAARQTIERSPAFDVSDAVLSPDNRWIAYQSSESGRPETYVRPFDRTGEKVRISSNGGSEPQWTVDGKAILFLSPDGNLMKADIAGNESLRVTKETMLFPISSAGMMSMMSLGQSHYAVTRDRILTREIPGGVDADPVNVLFSAR